MTYLVRLDNVLQMHVSDGHMVCAGPIRQELAVEYARGQLAGTPMCMQQYTRMFTYYRRPGHTADTQVQSPAAASEPEHIIVACRDQVMAQTLCSVTPIGSGI